MYIINTDQGFICGEWHNAGLKFTTRQEARRYTEGEIDLYGEFLIVDLKQSYCCEKVELEYIN